MLYLLRNSYHYIKSLIFYGWRLNKFGYKSIIFKPLHIDGITNIYIGKKVIIRDYSWLACMPLTNNKKPKLIIMDGVSIGHFNHIYATSKIIIEKNVLIADKVYISDNLHEYKNPKTPIIKQPIKQLKTMIIGEGCWIGENVCIIGSSIGKQSVIGANSVVTSDIPDYCVAVGAPAKIIKRYCFETSSWRKTNENGEF
jgi:acetyltransferase-like isoleucine patch superfamily enzyme